MMPLFSHWDRDPIFGGAVRNVIPSNYGCNPINYIYIVDKTSKLIPSPYY